MGENDEEDITASAASQDVASDMHIQTVCMSCGTPFTPMAYSTAVSCSACTGLCHSRCLVGGCCYLCQKTADITTERQGAKRKQQQQADKMVEHSAKRFKPAEVGDTVLVPIPDVDRGRCEYPNLKAIVLESHPEGHLWKLGCKTGVLDQWYSRNQFQPTLEKFMSVSDVSLEREVSLRTAAKQESMGGGQGYFKCNCTGNCQTKRCKCFKANLKCNSRCHNRRCCTNKD